MIVRKRLSDTGEYWDIGYYDPAGEWHIVKSYPFDYEAFAVLSYLNGGTEPSIWE